jgi:oligopeptide transport system permease protein
MLTIPSVILAEAFLSFLGLGVPPPASSLGALADEGAQVIAVHPILLAAPAVFMVVMLYSLNFLGDGLRDALDPRTKSAS